MQYILYILSGHAYVQLCMVILAHYNSCCINEFFSLWAARVFTQCKITLQKNLKLDILESKI